MEGFRHDAHPMGMLLSTVGALSTFYPDAKQIFDAKSRNHHVVRLIAKMPTIAAFAYRHSIGFPYVYPDNELSYTGNFLSMMKKMAEPRYVVNPVLERALDVLFILHADHEQNCSTNAMRSVGSAHTDPYSSVAAATAALYGPLHGGANEAVLRMLHELGDIKNVPAFVKEVKEGSGEKRLMGFGHRVYKNYDPRATVIKKLAEEVFEVTGKNPLLAIALELERIALQDDYFGSRGSSIRTWTSTPASSTRRWASTRPFSRCSSRSRGRPAGSRSGRSCCPIRTRRSPGRARSTRAPRAASTSRSTSVKRSGGQAFAQRGQTPRSVTV